MAEEGGAAGYSYVDIVGEFVFNQEIMVASCLFKHWLHTATEVVGPFLAFRRSLGTVVEVRMS